MREQRKQALLPKLRFPEFRDAGEWEKKKLGEVINIEYGSSLPESKRSEGAVPVVGSNGIIGYHGEYLITGPAIVIGRKGSVGQVNWIDRDCYPIDTTYYVNNKKPEGCLLPFLNVLLKHSDLPHLKNPSAVPGLNRESVHSLISYFPKLPEQQKIADCLSSLDELITAQTQKLDTLKAHKKGLMQQLFPAEGETLPKLRFPEFREAGEWEEKKLGLIGSFTGGGTPSKENASYWAGTNPWISSSDISDDNIQDICISRFISDEAIQETATKVVPANSILLVSRVGVGKLAITRKAICTSQDFTSFTPAKDHLVFLAYLLKSLKDKFFAFNQGMAIKGFTKDDTSNLRILLPSQAEQQKVADCLSSLDELITAQTQKLAALKAHKKGLMQQLFPSLGGVDGEAGRGGRSVVDEVQG